MNNHIHEMYSPLEQSRGPLCGEVSIKPFGGTLLPTLLSTPTMLSDGPDRPMYQGKCLSEKDIEATMAVSTRPYMVIPYATTSNFNHWRMELLQGEKVSLRRLPRQPVRPRIPSATGVHDTSITYLGMSYEADFAISKAYFVCLRWSSIL